MPTFRSGAAILTILAGVAAAAISAPGTDRAAAATCANTWQPVCGINKFGVRRTFTNACWVAASGARVLHKGRCQHLCSQTVHPVCAMDASTHRQKTYANLCWSEVANATWMHDGKCHWRPRHRRHRHR